MRAVGVVLPAMALTGEVFADLNAAARGSKRPVLDPSSPASIAWRAVDNVAQIGALGLGIGLLQEMSGLKSVGMSDLAGFVAGPTITALGQELQAPIKAAYYGMGGDTNEAERQLYEFLRRGVRRLPYVGPGGANLAFPSSAQPESESIDTLWDRLGLSDRSVARKRMGDLDARLRHIR
jgi:hypothetical protein